MPQPQQVRLDPPSTLNPDLWALARGDSTIDPEDLIEAIDREASRPPHDFRTRLLLRDSFVALQRRYGAEIAMNRLSASSALVIKGILAEDLGHPGFPTLGSRIMEPMDSKTLLQFLREPGTRAAQDARIEIGGSGALILAGLLRRHTDDLDAVDEVPVALRAEHTLLDSLATRHGLRLSHFQAHYLPQGWARRLASMGRFGTLEVYVVDPLDIFLRKLFSAREKDLDDLRVVAPALDRSTIEGRSRGDCASFLAEPALHANADRNWYIVFGEQLPA